LRTCRKKLDGDLRDRPCLNYHIKRCLAPCAGKVSQEEYLKLVEAACKVLAGRDEEVMEDLESQMQQAAAKLDFERAAVLRDRLSALKAVTEKQKMEAADEVDRDVVGMVCQEELCCFLIFIFRGGKLIGRQRYLVPLERQLDDTNSQLLTAFLRQYYSKASTIPKEVIVPCQPEEQALLEEWLGKLAERKVQLREPKRGEKKQLLSLAARNAEYALQEEILQRQRKENGPRWGLEQLSEILDLASPPERIEAYDISNIQGTDSVASMVVFLEGVPAKEEYRRFKMKTPGPNDFAMMAEVIARRFRRGLRERKEGGGKFAAFPDLVLIDGGAGQLHAALDAMRQLDVKLPTVGLAKREEELYVEGRSEPLFLPRDSQVLYLLQRIRDEAHRFAVTFHRGLRQKRNTGSVLDEIEGVGPARRKALIRRFGSSRAVSQASPAELQQVEGISAELAQRIYDYFHN
jgi:excinuclease ABC subunit C